MNLFFPTSALKQHCGLASWSVFDVVRPDRSLVATLVFAGVFSGMQMVLGHSAYEPYLFSTFVGNGPGAIDGLSGVARFDGPFATAVDAIGNIYVVDSYNDTIRKITPGGFVVTIAGLAGQEGTSDGVGNAARFYSPKGVALDSSGNIFVADSGNDTIRKITSEGMVSTVAGAAGITGTSDGRGAAARFNFPTGIAVDNDGNLYVADNVNNTIRKITSDADVTTLAGSAGQKGSTDGMGADARFRSPTAVAAGDDAVLYVADAGNDTIRKITPDGVVSTLAGSPGKKGSVDQSGNAARFDSPFGVSVDGSGNVYVADTFNHTIRKITPAGSVTTLAGFADEGEAGGGASDGIGTAARFNRPRGLCATSAGTLFVADTHNNTIRTVTADGAVSTLAGKADIGSEDGLGSAARFNKPDGLAFDRSDNLYVVDNINQTIRKVTPAGVVTTLAGEVGVVGHSDGVGASAHFNFPRSIVADAKGNLYVSDRLNYTIRKITPAGEVSTLAGSPGNLGSADGLGDAARFNEPFGLAIDAAGNIFVADTANETIRMVTPAGFVTTIAGTAGVAGYLDGEGLAAQFHQPSGLALDKMGNLYVGDTFNHAIRRITSGGSVSTFAGVGRSKGSDDGIGAEALFFRPSGVSIDSLGNLYVADSNNYLVRKITPSASVTTLGGLVGRRGGANGAGSGARFFEPLGMAVNSQNQLFLTDNVNSTVRKASPAPPVIESPLAATAVLGQEFAYQFTTDGATELGAGGLPPGLAFDAPLAAIVGTPGTTGTFSVQLTASNSKGTTAATLTLTVAPPIEAQMNLVSGASAAGAIGNFFSYQLKAAGVNPTTSITAVGMPAGLTLDQSTGLLSGVLSNQLLVDPTTDLVTMAPAPETSSLVTFALRDGGHVTNSTLELSFTSDPTLPVIISPNQANVTIGQPFNYKIVAPVSPDPAAGPITYSYAGTLPKGLSFDSATGVISGIFDSQTEQKAGQFVRKALSAGVQNIVGNIQLFAQNKRGTGTIPLLFSDAPPGAGNVSTRLLAGSGDDAAIGGFIVTGSAAKKVLVRALGPSLEENGQALSGTLQDPTLEVRNGFGKLIASNDDWRTNQESEITATGISPLDDRESASMLTLDPGAYTAIISSKSKTSGLVLFETYDLGTASIDVSRNAMIANMSTRGLVAGETDLLIAGFIVEGNTPSNVLIRALGPELAAVGISHPIADPILQLRNFNGDLLAENDDWETTQEGLILFTNAAPANPRESAIYDTLMAGSYTAVVASKSTNNGVGLVEVYILP
ncbi:MAG TPA: putative Ig domain-containing protein [Chthoniobacterales bacterium]|jgi:sugar lactone lactonase YvrE